MAKRIPGRIIFARWVSGGKIVSANNLFLTAHRAHRAHRNMGNPDKFIGIDLSNIYLATSFMSYFAIIISI